jgi:3-hydroxy-9,10-secoandrosta-1,3,5(10)-triene-9,17-dione monooxygenase reductase component
VPNSAWFGPKYDLATVYTSRVLALMNDDDQKDLRQAFGQFVTGITVITTTSTDNEPIGITANSFSSVSLSPPMVMWSLADDAMSKAAFEQAEFFCVHDLTSSQLEISRQFACRGNDKFAGVSWSWGEVSLPMLDDYVARFVCRTRSQYQVGDHIVFVGEVIAHDRTSQRPLVYHGGQYALAERRAIEDAARSLVDRTAFSDDRRNKKT